jgi:hypothetical protein
VKDEFERIWKEAVVAYCPGICLDELRKTAINLIQVADLRIEI